jgi:ABC-type polysaccharide/polyol phosphate transport system ATPase subunit
MNTSSISEDRVSGPPAELTFDQVSLRFRKHWVGRQLRQVALDALRRKTPPAHAEVWLYRDLSFAIGHGERVGVIGSNGAGKSTLLKLMLGVYRPTLGRVVVHGRISALIELGAGFNCELSGAENILLSGALQGFSPREMRDKTDRILDFAGLQDSRDTPTKYYSSGMLLRLAFSIATDINPEILLIDEIFSVGDAEFSQRAMQRMRQLLDTSHIAVLISHNLSLIQEFCSRVLWLRGGAIVQDGDPASVCQAYADFAAGGS